MDKWEIHWRLPFLESLWWRFIPGIEVTVRWPVGPDSADPNEHYRPWMERNVGRQGWDWNWRIGTIAADNGTGTRGYDTLTIKLRRKHAALASFLAIKWG